jgi:arylsulfatase A-like enzyme/tetratricopeptide (TPR) repeat protein
MVASGCSQRPANAPTSAPPPDLLLITVDALRADRVGTGRTPALDALAERGVSFEHAYTVAPLTRPSHATLLSGALPPDHGVRLDTDRLARRQPTLARLARDAGYETAAFVASHVLDRSSGLAAGFTTYDDRVRRDWVATAAPAGERPAAEVADRVIDWLKARPAPATHRPLFVWVHFNDARAPHVSPAGGGAGAKTGPYDAEVAFVDAHVGRVLDAVRQVGREARTFVVVAGDHGESLGDHGELTHGLTLYESAVRVPLLLVGPGIAPGVSPETVSLVDVAPTILARLRVSPPPSMRGRDLLAPPTAPGRVYAETRLPEAAGGEARYMVTDGRLKLIAGGTTELYDLQRDAGEHQNLSRTQPDSLPALEAVLASISSAGRGATDGAGISLETSSSTTLQEPSGRARSSKRGGPASPATVTRAWRQLEDALSLLSAGDVRRASLVLAGLARSHPEAYAFQRAHALALVDSGKSADAYRVLVALVGRRPGDASLYHDLALAAGLARKPEEARRAEQAALALEPGFAPAHDGIGRLALESGEAADARRAFESAVAHDPTNAGYWAHLGLASRALRDASAAERAFRRALELDDQCPHALDGLALLLMDAGEVREAVTLLERVTQTTPAYVGGWLNLGLAYQKSGRLDEARAAIQRVEQAPPRFAREREAATKAFNSLGRS